MNSTDYNERIRAKQHYFNELDKALASDGDDNPDPGRQASMQQLKAARARGLVTRRDELPIPAAKSKPDRDSRDRADPPTLHPAPPGFDHSGTHPHSDRASCATPVRRPSSTEGPISESKTAIAPSSALAQPTGKRKRKPSIEQVSSDQQIFSGLKFYFFPNNDTHPARRLRILKARAYGATWLRDFDETVTHIIVDQALSCNLLLKFIKAETLPGSVVVVSENWPAYCISYKMLVDPTQAQFRIKDHKPPAPKARSTGSDTSLQLKPAPKSVQARPPETQITSETTSAVSRDSHRSERHRRRDCSTR